MLEDGHAEAQHNRNRNTAVWMAYHLTATTGQPVQPWELLGEDAPPDTGGASASAQSDAAQKFEAMMAAIATREKGNECPAS